MSVLIYGHHGDEHALAVSRALARDGVQSAIFCSDEFPCDATVSIDPADDCWRLTGPAIDADMRDFDVVWNRRNKPAGVLTGLHPDDQSVAQAESTAFLRALRILPPPSAQIWVNDEIRQRVISGKPAQLALAREVGLTIPHTLISNDPAAVRRFVADHGSVIVKAIDKIGWIDDGGQTVLPTTALTLGDCADDVSIRACPMIYQRRVDKAHELRVVMFGDDILAVRLDSQRDPAGQLDWRVAEPGSFAIEEVDLPPNLVEKLRAFCRRAGVLHGSFDLAVDNAGNVTMFEFNVQGQTLWIEMWNPQIRVLDRLAQFLASPGRDFVYRETRRHAFADLVPPDDTAIHA